MCLILFAHRYPPAYRLILAVNRDEFFERPTAPAAFWGDASGMLAGRDLQSGGTWLGVTRTGRFAAVTNYREPRPQKPGAPSRGVLVTQFLRGRDDPEAYLHRLARTADRYNGFNLIVGDAERLCYFSNREGRVRTVEPGVGAEWERVLSPIFISTPAYGTRSSTVLTIDEEGQVTFVEQTVPVLGEAPVRNAFSFRISSQPS